MKRKKLPRNVLRAMESHNLIGSIFVESANDKDICELSNEICLKIDKLIQLIRSKEKS